MIAGVIVGIIAFVLLITIPLIKYRKKHKSSYVVFIHTLQEGKDKKEQIETIIKEPAFEHDIDEKLEEIYKNASQMGVRPWKSRSYESSDLYKALAFAKTYTQNEKQVAVVCSAESESDSEFYSRGKRTTVVTTTKTRYSFIAFAGCGEFRNKSDV